MSRMTTITPPPGRRPMPGGPRPDLPVPAPRGGGGDGQVSVPPRPQVQQFGRQAPQVQGNIGRQAMPDDIARKMKARAIDRFSQPLRAQRERIGDRSAALGLGTGASMGALTQLSLADLANRANVSNTVDVAQNAQNWQGSLQRYNAMLGENQAARGNYGANLQGTALGNRQYEFGSQFNEGQRRFDTGMAQDWGKFDAGMRQRAGEFGANLGLGYDRLNEGQRQFDERIGEQSRQFGDRTALDYARLAEGGRQFDTGTSAGLYGQENQLDFGYDRINEQARQFDQNNELNWDQSGRGWANVDRGFSGLNENARQFQELMPLREQQALGQLSRLAGGFGPPPADPRLPAGYGTENTNRLLQPNPAGLPNQYA